MTPLDLFVCIVLVPIFLVVLARDIRRQLGISDQIKLAITLIKDGRDAWERFEHARSIQWSHKITELKIEETDRGVFWVEFKNLRFCTSLSGENAITRNEAELLRKTLREYHFFSPPKRLDMDKKIDEVEESLSRLELEMLIIKMKRDGRIK